MSEIVDIVTRTIDMGSTHWHIAWFMCFYFSICIYQLEMDRAEEAENCCHCSCSNYSSVCKWNGDLAYCDLHTLLNYNRSFTSILLSLWTFANPVEVVMDLSRSFSILRNNVLFATICNLLQKSLHQRKNWPMVSTMINDKQTKLIPLEYVQVKNKPCFLGLV